MTPHISPTQRDTALLRRSLEDLQRLMRDDSPTEGLNYTQLLKLYKQLCKRLQESVNASVAWTQWKIIHLSRDGKNLACGAQIAFDPEWPSVGFAADWEAVTCPDCRNTSVWRELAGLPNPRNAGRKRGNFVKTHQQVTVYPNDWDAYARLPNRSRFVRDAIASRLAERSLPPAALALADAIAKRTGRHRGEVLLDGLKAIATAEELAAADAG